MTEVKLFSNKYNKDTCIYKLDEIHNGYLSQDKKTLYILEKHTEDNDRYDMELIEDESYGLVHGTTYKVQIAWPTKMINEITDKLRKEMEE